MPVTLLFAALVIGSIYFLYSSASSELAPQEDQGVVILLPTSAPDATLQQKELFGDQVQGIMAKVPEADQSFQVDEPGAVDRRHHPETVGRAARATPRRSNGSCRTSSTPSPDRRSRRSCRRHCRARRGCRFSSC